MAMAGLHWGGEEASPALEQQSGRQSSLSPPQPGDSTRFSVRETARGYGFGSWLVFVVVCEAQGFTASSFPSW